MFVTARAADCLIISLFIWVWRHCFTTIFVPPAIHGKSNCIQSSTAKILLGRQTAVYRTQNEVYRTQEVNIVIQNKDLNW